MIEPTAKQQTALALRRKGLTWREIAQEVGSSVRYAQALADKALLKEQRAARKQQRGA